MPKDDLVWAADSFGGVIRRAREAKGLTQKEVAKSCENITSMYISQIENSERIPSDRVCRLLAHALDLNERRLLLMAYLANAPAEIKDFFIREPAASYGGPLEERFRGLLDVVQQLPKQKKEQIAKAWEETLKLVVH